MTIFEIRGPDGTIHEVDGPDLQTANAALQLSLTPAQDTATEEPAQYSTEQFLANAYHNAGKMVRGFADIGRDPMGALVGVGKLGAGAVERLIPGQQPEEDQASGFAKQLGRDVGFNRQGQGYETGVAGVQWSPAQLGQNFYERPLDVASTLSLPFAGAEALPGKLGRIAGTTSRVLNAPAYAPAKVAVAGMRTLGRATDLAKDVPGVGTAARQVTDTLNPRLAAIRDLPTTAEFATKADNTYTAAENLGVGISQGSYQNLVNYIRTNMKKEGFDPARQPLAAKELAILEKDIVKPQAPGPMANITGIRPTTPNTPVSLRKAEANRSQISQLIRDAAKAGDGRTARMAEIMRNSYDDFMESGAAKWAAPRGITNPAEAQRLFKEARGIYRTKVKAGVLDEIGYQAELDAGANYTQAGLETALRRRYRNLLRNKAQRGMWTADELAAIRGVASRNLLRPANIARGLGKMAPVGAIMKGITPAVGGAVGGTVGGLAAFAAGGPVAGAYGAAKGGLIGAAALSGAGIAGRELATVATQRAVQRVQALVRSGKPLPPNSPPLEARIYNALIATALKNQQQ